MPGTRKLGRPTDHRMAMLRAMVTYLFESGKIETTVTRAKEVRPIAEKMITLAKEGRGRVLGRQGSGPVCHLVGSSLYSLFK